MIKSIDDHLKDFSNICPDKEALTLKRYPFPLKSINVEHQTDYFYKSLRLVINLCIHKSRTCIFDKEPSLLEYEFMSCC